MDDIIMHQLGVIINSVQRAELIIETGMYYGQNKEVVLYELIKAHAQIENLIREIAPERFATTLKSVSVTPAITLDKVRICHICGNPDCQSDHK